MHCELIHPCPGQAQGRDDLMFNRRGRDSNPRCSYPQTAFRMRLLQPLGHLSKVTGILAKIRGALKAGRAGEKKTIRDSLLA